MAVNRSQHRGIAPTNAEMKDLPFFFRCAIISFQQQDTKNLDPPL